MWILLMSLFAAALVIAGTYFVGRLFWLVFGSTLVVWRLSRRDRAQRRLEYASLSSEALRQELSTDPFLADLCSDPNVKLFLDRLASHDEVSLRQQFSKSKLYRMLVCAELAAGRTGRPEAVDSIDTIFALLDELSRRELANVRHAG